MKNVTIYDIAKALNVNPSTVNRALNGKNGVGEALRARIASYASAAGYHINPAAKSLNRQLKIGLVMQHSIRAFEDQLLEGIDAAFTELEAMNVTLEKRVVKTREEYEHTCAEFCAEGFNAVLLQPLRQSDMTEIFQAFDKESISVCTIVSDVPQAKRLFSIHLDGKTTGCIAAELLYRFTRGANAVVFTGDTDIPIHEEILRGFQVFAQGRFDITSVYTDSAKPDIARRNVKSVLAEYDDFGSVFVSTANSVPICEEIAASGRSIQVIAMDVFDEVVQYLRRGVISALLYQQPRYQGYMALWNMVKYLDGYLAPRNEIIQPQIVMQSNLGSFWRGEKEQS